MRTQQVLTQRGVESAKPKAARYGKRDGVVPGLRLLVFPAGEKTFALFTRVNDRLVNFKIGSASTLTLAKARELARGKLEEIAGGEDPRTSRSQAADAEAETVTVVVERFIARHVKVNNRTAGEIERKLRVEVLPRWGRRPIASITQKDVHCAAGFDRRPRRPYPGQPRAGDITEVFQLGLRTRNARPFAMRPRQGAIGGKQARSRAR